LNAPSRQHRRLDLEYPGVVDPCFLPDWNPDLFDGLGRIGPLVARHRSLPAGRLPGRGGITVPGQRERAVAGLSDDGTTTTPQEGAIALPGAAVAHLPFVLASRVRVGITARPPAGGRSGPGATPLAGG